MQKYVICNTVNFSHTIGYLMNDFIPATRDITGLNLVNRKLTRYLKDMGAKFYKTGSMQIE